MSGFVTDHMVECVMCLASVDTREETDGGDPYGCEISGIGWVCSPECYDDALERVDPALKGGDA